jgi:TIR domain
MNTRTHKKGTRGGHGPLATAAAPPARGKSTVFLSWSGEESHAAAERLNELLTTLFPGLDVWLSSEDIRVGDDWFAALTSSLERTRFGIFVLTAEAMASQWLLFEVGALAAKSGEKALIPIRLGIDEDAEALKRGPLEKFQSAVFEKEGVRRIVKRINDEHRRQRLPDQVLDLAFDNAWADFEAKWKAARALLADRRYDVFLSVPMAAFETDELYVAFRAEAKKVFDALRDKCGLSVFWAMEHIETKADFEVHDVSAEEDFKALRCSNNFLMIYPSRVVTSSLCEAGYALARDMPILMFVRQQDDLPFLMRQLPNSFKRVRIYDGEVWQNGADIAKLIVKNHETWFVRCL